MLFFEKSGSWLGSCCGFLLNLRFFVLLDNFLNLRCFVLVDNFLSLRFFGSLGLVLGKFFRRILRVGLLPAAAAGFAPQLVFILPAVAACFTPQLDFVVPSYRCTFVPLLCCTFVPLLRCTFVPLSFGALSPSRLELDTSISFSAFSFLGVAPQSLSFSNSSSSSNCIVFLGGRPFVSQVLRCQMT